MGSADEIFRRAAGSGGGRGRRAGPRWRAAAVRGGAEPSGAGRCGGPSPCGRRALGEPRSLETSLGGAGRQGHGSTAERRGRGGQGRGGHGAADSLMGLLAVRLPSGEGDGDFDTGVCHSAGVCPCLKGWRQKSLTRVVFIHFMCCN